MKRLTQTIAELRGGLVDLEASRQISDILERVRESGCKGSFTLQLTFDPHGKDNTEIHVTAKLTAKAPPKPDIGERSILFLNNNNDLVRNPSNQPGLSGVDGDKADGSSPAEQRRTG